MDKVPQNMLMDFSELLADPFPLVHLVGFEIDAVRGTLDRHPAVFAATEAADEPAQSRTRPLPFSLMTVDAF
jgi:hypothetical protein